MSFNSFEFAIFFPIVLLIFYLIPNRVRRYYLVLCSAVFYMSYDIKAIVVLFFVSIISYLGGLFIKKNRRKIILFSFVILTILPLILLKYTNVMKGMFIPLGISFFSLQGISYIVDVYKGYNDKVDFVDYFNYMTFFPTIVSGPIKKISDFINDSNQNKIFDYDRIRVGLYMMALGFVEKFYLADSSSKLVMNVFDKDYDLAGSVILLAIITYGLQLYFDFAGYSYIAIGAAYILGFNIPENFRQPYFATSIKDFWRRWHISLSTFLKDYVYFPLGGSRCSVCRKYLNLLITFLVSGIWHGAGMTYIIWGLLHGIYQIFGDIKLRFKWMKAPLVLKRLMVFILVDFAWLFFRAGSVNQAFSFINKMIFNFNINALSDGWIFEKGLNKIQLCLWIIVAAVIFIYDSAREKEKDIFNYIINMKVYKRWVLYAIITGIIIVGILSNIGINSGAFIYGGF